LRNITTGANGHAGLYIYQGSGNNIDRIVANYNFDAEDEGESADGISINSGQANIIKNCTTSHNDDDGIDTWQSTYNFIDNCVSSYNGTGYINPYRPPDTENIAGDGNGYKLGGPGGHNTVVNSLAYKNSAYGFAKNTGVGNTCYNDRAIGNAWGPTSFPKGESCWVNVRSY
jgi:hypothetical protein